MEKKRISRSKPWGIESFRDWLVEEEEEPAKEIKKEKHRRVVSGNAGEKSILSRR